ncbi:MAG: DMT family transporter [Alphaproteobacteria bacterium]|nr:DMT family transporter [Alphaproteobacteria bacterium]
MTALADSQARLATLGVIVAVLGTMLGGTVDVLNKLLAQDIPVLQILWVRFLVFVPIAALLAWRPGQGVSWRSKRPVLQSVRALVLVAATWLFVSAMKDIALADLHSVAASSPLIVVALSVPMLKEPVGWRRWSAVAVGFAGMLVILRPGFQSVNAGIWLALGGTLLWALYQILLRMVGREEDAATSTVWTAAVGAAALTAIAPFDWVWPDTRAWVLLAAVALFGAFAHYTWSRALVLMPAAALQPFTYLMIVYAVISGWLVFGDLPDRWTVLGAVIIVASGLYAFHRERVRARAQT